MNVRKRLMTILMVLLILVAAFLPLLYNPVFGEPMSVHAETVKTKKRKLYTWNRIYTSADLPRQIGKTYKLLMIPDYKINGAYQYYVSTKAERFHQSREGAEALDITSLSAEMYPDLDSFISKGDFDTPEIKYLCKTDPKNADSPKYSLSIPGRNGERDELSKWLEGREFTIQTFTAEEKPSHPNMSILFEEVSGGEDPWFTFGTINAGFFKTRDVLGFDPPVDTGIWRGSYFLLFYGEEFEIGEVDSMVVGSGYTNTIEGITCLYDNKKIVVEHGGTLVIDGLFFNYGNIEVRKGGTLIIKSGGGMSYLYYDTVMSIRKSLGRFEIPTTSSLVCKGNLLIEEDAFFLPDTYTVIVLRGNVTNEGYFASEGRVQFQDAYLENRGKILLGKGLEGKHATIHDFMMVMSDEAYNNFYLNTLNSGLMKEQTGKSRLLGFWSDCVQGSSSHGSYNKNYVKNSRSSRTGITDVKIYEYQSAYDGSKLHEYSSTYDGSKLFTVVGTFD